MSDLAVSAESKDANVQPAPKRVHTPLYHFLLTVVTMVGGTLNVTIKQLLLPVQIAQIAPVGTATAFFVVASTGAVVGMISAPLIGAFSDRTRGRLGKRRPWIVFGMVTAALGTMTMALSHTLAPLICGEILAQIGVDAILAVVTALIPDQMQQHRRWLVTALVGMAPNIGGVIGLVLVSRVTDLHHIAQGYLMMTALSMVCVGAFLLVLREAPTPTQEVVPPFHIGHFVRGFVSPLGERDFRYTFLSRCCAYLSFTLLGAYTLFYLQDGLHVSVTAAAAKLTTFQFLSTAVLFVVSVLAGYGARRWGRLKPFVAGGALVMATGLFLMAFFPLWSALLVAAGVFGAGFGAYLGVDVSLAVAVLPTQTNNGKDIGLMYTAIFLPLALSPAVGAIALNVFHSYLVVFATAGCASILAALLIWPIQSVR